MEPEESVRGWKCGEEDCRDSGGDRMLEIVVHEIRGYCPVYKVGDRIVIDDIELKSGTLVVYHFS